WRSTVSGCGCSTRSSSSLASRSSSISISSSSSKLSAISASMRLAVPLLSPVPFFFMAALSIILPMHIVDDDAGALGRHRQPLLVLERALGVLVAALPVLPHRCSRKLVVLGVALVGLLLVDQMQDRDLRQVGQLVAHLPLVVVQRFVGDLGQRLVQA